MILIIDNYDSFTYNLYQMVACLSPDVVVHRNDKITVDEVLRLQPSHIILSPGPGRPEQAGICVSLIQTLVAQKSMIPLLGVCLGHQALSIALGGKVIGANEICHGKADVVYHQNNNIYAALPNPFQVGRYHSLIVDKTSLPDCLTVDASNAKELIMGMRHKSLPLYGVQFHPESILTPQGHSLLRAFI